MSMNWLEGPNDQADGPGRRMTMPVFAGQKLVVVGGAIWDVDGGVMAGRN